jgi:hypothetical protein
MAYRFTNTDKWNDNWFIELKPNEKLLFDFLCDNCDIAGFYELSLRNMKSALHPLTEDEVKAAFKGIEKSYVLSRDKRVLFLKNFCKHQKNVPLNPNNKAHVGIFNKVNIYGDRFAHDLMKIIHSGYKPSQNKGASTPLESTTGNGIGNIDFINFWSLYDKKIGNKYACEKKWNKLKTSIQKKIIEILPQWKLQFDDKQFQPYPETFLNQERWNDEIENPKPKQQKFTGGQSLQTSKINSAIKRTDEFENLLKANAHA